MPHIHDKIDFTVTVFIVYAESVLLVHHPRYGKWIPPGGHIELDENPEQALYREIEEETGLQVTILSDKPDLQSSGTKFLLTPNFLDIHDANPPHQHIGLTYFALASNAQFSKSEEHSDMKWVTLTDLDNPSYNLSEAIKFYAREAVKKSKENLSS